MLNGENTCRKDEFKRNVELETLLKEINSDLEICENELLGKEYEEYPVVFIMGPLRSGSTLLSQWLADTGEFAYPSNLLSRFYGAPILGAKIQQMLTNSKYNFRNELFEFNSEISFESSNGKTRGILEPNEFWYFWRRFIPEDIYKYNDEALLDIVDIKKMRKELYGMATVFGKPFVLKGAICNYNIKFLEKVFPKSLFIYISRNEDATIKSIIEARKRQYGNENQWYSFKIPEYSRIIKIEDPEEQAREQVRCIHKAIEKGLETISNEKKLLIKYEEFCRNPENVYNQIYIKLKKQGYSINAKYKGKENFIVR